MALFVALACACGGGSADKGTGPAPVPVPVPVPTTNGPLGPLAAGTTYLSPNSWLEYVPGTAPLIIVAPHGGSVAPAELPDRVCTACVTVTDVNTQELSRAIIDAFARRTGVRPHLVVNRLHRRKFDGNRALAEATNGHAPLAPTWTWLQSAVDSARLRVAAAHGRGLLIDLHGHGHAIARLELGYLLSASDLRRTDAALATAGDMGRTSIARLAGDAKSGERGTALLRGPNSLGTLLVGAGVPSVPSAGTPAPLIGEDYFDGGFNTARNGSASGGAIDAIQIETHFTGVRDNANSRAAFADVLAGVLVQYLERHYGWRP
ncbi:MAG TPA: hypothetical protein VE869_17760 [Gemmatimonas sp.]|nr:hypothetical protein [Gemmatimonas sp.]